MFSNVQQSVQQHHPQQNLCFNFNVRINVNVNTKNTRSMLSTTSTMDETKKMGTNKLLSNTSNPTSTATNTKGQTHGIKIRRTIAASIPTKSAFNTQQKEQKVHQLHQIQIQLNSNNSISLLFVVNLLFLLLLSFCCDVCKSQNDAELVLNARENFAQSINRNLSVLFSSELNDSDDIVIEEHITHACMQRCVDEAEDFYTENYVKCDRGDNSEKCFLTRCTKGCRMWWHAVQELESCQEVCSSTNFHPYDMPCLSACETAQYLFWHSLRLALEDYVSGIMPQLNASEQVNSLSLNWPIILPDYLLANHPFNIQYEYADAEQDNKLTNNVTDGNKSKWFYLSDYNCNDNFHCDVTESLMPYTSYRFRFELPLGENSNNILYSPPTIIHKTLPAGAPVSIPIVREIIAMDHKHIAIYWKAGKYINGPLKGYKIKLLAHSKVVEEKLLSAKSSQHIFSRLTPNTNYTVQLGMLNKDSIGPFVETFAITRMSPNLSQNVEEIGILIADNFRVYLKTLEPISDSKLIFESEHLLTDLAIIMVTQQLFVVDVVGRIFSCDVDKPQACQRLKLDFGKFRLKPEKISVDWLNHKIFIAGKNLNQNHSIWSIVTTDFNGSFHDVVTTNLAEEIVQMNVDPLNGWLFWITSRGLQRMNLASKSCSYIYTMRATTNGTHNINRNVNTSGGYFINDYERFLLLVYNKDESELYEMSYDGDYRQRLFHDKNDNNKSIEPVTRLLKGAWRSFVNIGNTLMVATNGTHIMRYNYETNEFGHWPLEDIEMCWYVQPVQPKQLHQLYPLQPMPIARVAPSNLQVVLTANMATITWSPPPLLLINEHLQTAYAWHQWEYELEILDVASNSAFQIRNIRTTYFHVEKLQAQNLYKLRVRASFANRISVGGSDAGSSSAASLETPWSAEILTRTWPLRAHNFLWMTQHGGLYETNEMGTNFKFLANITTNAQVGEFLQLNSTVYYVTAAKNPVLKCKNLINPELACMLHAENVQSLAYDWRGGRLYWIDILRNCVMRSDLHGRAREMLPIFGAKLISIDSYNGYIYYTTGTRLMRRMLSGTQSADARVYHFVNGLHDRIKGFALNLQQQQLFWIVQKHEGFVILYKRPVDGDATTMASSEPFAGDIMPDSLQYISEIDSLLWLSENSTYAALASLHDLKHFAWMRPSFTDEKLAALHLKSEFTPYIDESVIPQAVLNSSVRIDAGYWDDFNVKWDPVSTVENYTVFYKISSSYGSSVQTVEVTEPLLHIHDLKKPQLKLNISITPHTYWRAGPMTHVQILTPAATPTQPKRLRVFIQRHDLPLQNGPNVNALVRWEQPEQSSGTAIVGYKIFCWLGAELKAEKTVNANGPLETSFENLTVAETYTFQVQTMTAARAIGTVIAANTAAASEKSAIHVMHINTVVQSMPRVLYTTSEHIAVYDLDIGNSKVLVHTANEVEHVTMILGENRIIWVNENVELMSFVPGAPPMKLARMRAEVLSLTVDWVARIVYWAEVNVTTNSIDIYALNLCDFEGKVMQGVNILSLNQGRWLRDMHVLPYNRVLLWLEFGKDEQQARLVGWRLTHMRPFKLKPTNAVLRMFEGAQLADHETVNLIDSKGKLCAYDVQRQLCTPQKMHYNVHTDVGVEITRDAGFIYMLRNDSLRVYNRRKMGLEYLRELPQARKMKAYNYQEYPERHCLVPEVQESVGMDKYLQPDIEELEETFITLELPTLQMNKETCTLTMPGIKYTITLTDDHSKTRVLQTQHSFVNITDLRPFSDYWLQLNITTYYQQKLGRPVIFSEQRQLRTARGTPTAPRNFQARAISPHEIQISWQPPAVLNTDNVSYELHWQQLNASQIAQRMVSNTELYLPNLDPHANYLLQLKVYATPTKFNISKPIIVTTYDTPPPLKLLEATAYNLTLSWQTNADIINAVLVCVTLNADDDFSIDITNNTNQIKVMDLRPKTRYQFYLELQYVHNAPAYQWPEFHNERFIFDTLGDAPSSPGRPQIEMITSDIFKVFWEPANNNGAPIIEYELEALQIHKRKRRSGDTQMKTSTFNRGGNVTNNAHITYQSLPWLEEPKVLEDKWISYCNTSELSCIIRDIHTQHLLMFRVHARNEPYGWGPYSIESEYIAEPFVTAEKRSSLILAIIAPAAVVSSCVIVLFIMKQLQNRRSRKKQKLFAKSRPSIWSNLSTAQQHQLMSARNRGFSITSNSTSFCGGMNSGVCNPLSDADIALLPQIKWHQIKILNFLGSGAFGEVYEGLLHYDDDEKPEKVAIKSLRKGSSEFSELLQEAQLMSNFKHENIVGLIGVCFDPESISIIMEHMEGGDLLSYLREARSNSTKSLASLELLDLITMCIDVATGCSYLEDMHFVHRDLACRNCLVSSKVPNNRVVKIGDFGLARDIYKNDYYRKEGEGLMPIRWMAPESLMDGIFTTQSDVWAFGVLCWEILTLGRQPYAMRNNFDVLNYVKDGGRLEQPENCPDKLFNLMQQCWLSDPDTRPTFRRCLNTLISIKTEMRRINFGYNLDDVGEHAMYANSHGILLSNFLSGPLPKIDEEVIARGIMTDSKPFNNGTWSELKVQFGDVLETAAEIEMETTQPTGDQPKQKKYKEIIHINTFSNENPDYLYGNNEGVSRF